MEFKAAFFLDDFHSTGGQLRALETIFPSAPRRGILFVQDVDR
jgi:hypothetical protein